MDDQNNKKEDTFEVHFKNGMDELYKKQYDKALEYFEMAREHYKLKNENVKVKCLLNIGATYIFLWKENKDQSSYLQKAITVLSCGRQICKADEYCNCDDEQSMILCQTTRANIFFNLAYASENLGKVDDSKKYYNKARELYCKTGDMENEVNCLKRVIEVSKSQNDDVSAADAFKCLADLYAREGKLFLQAESLISEAERLHECKEEEKAHLKANNAFHVLDTLPKTKLKNELAATIFNDIGLLFCRLDPVVFEKDMFWKTLGEKSKHCFETAIAILDDIGQTKSQLKAIILQNLGAALGFQGQHREALERYEQANEIYGQIRSRRGQSHCFINRAFTRSKIREPLEESDLRNIELDFTQALTAAKDADDKELIWRSFEGLGTTYFLLHDYSKAVDCFKEALFYLEDQDGIKDRIINKLEFVLRTRIGGWSR